MIPGDDSMTARRSDPSATPNRARARAAGSRRTRPLDAERARLAAAADPASRWRRWGPYLSQRQWGTVREDYSADGNAWDYLSHDDARSRAYRWGEDGLLGISDDQQRLCFALALWNGRDQILKERLFGLSGQQGNHGEDVKELYWFLDATPTHSYLRALYKYPQGPFPYDDLVAENARRTRSDPEYELLDTGAFDEDRYFDVEVEYAKAQPEDIVIRITATNHGPDPARLVVVPTLWFRNTWSWGRHKTRPRLRDGGTAGDARVVDAAHPRLGAYRLLAEAADGQEPELLFTENETNVARLYGAPNPAPFVKDAIHASVVDGRRDAVNPDGEGSKVAVKYDLTLAPGETRQLRLRLFSSDETPDADHPADHAPHAPPDEAAPFADCDDLVATRQAKADAFYHPLGDSRMTRDERLVQRQAFANLLWSEQ